MTHSHTQITYRSFKKSTKSKPTPFTLKSGVNKGNRRIWIEGSRLKDAGMLRGTILYRSMLDNKMVLSTNPADGRKHKIAGTSDRPILDLCGKWVTEFIGKYPNFTATVTSDTITIVPSK